MGTHAPISLLSPAAMASLIAILDLKGKPLIQRSYRDDVPASYVERFLPLVLDLEEEGQQVTPCISAQGINYMHIRHSNLYRECLAGCVPDRGRLEARWAVRPLGRRRMRWEGKGRSDGLDGARVRGFTMRVACMNGRDAIGLHHYQRKVAQDHRPSFLEI